MIKKKIVIELQFGSEEQQELHMQMLECSIRQSMGMINGTMYQDERIAHHKDNKMDVFYFDKE